MPEDVKIGEIHVKEIPEVAGECRNVPADAGTFRKMFR
jgi:hypothetical protein